MITDTYVRKVVMRKVIDGDTIEVIVDCGFRRYSVERLRVLGIDTPEVVGANRAEGLKAKTFVSELLPIGSEFIIKSHKSDSFGRWLADVYFEEGTGVYKSLADVLIDNGLATEDIH